MSTQQVAQTILSQFGGQRSMAMIGGKHVAATSEGRGGLSFRHMTGKCAGKSVNHCTITLQSSDLYVMEIGYVRGHNYTVREKHEGVYCDQLRALFESSTGLYLTL